MLISYFLVLRLVLCGLDCFLWRRYDWFLGVKFCIVVGIVLGLGSLNKSRRVFWFMF